MFYLLTKCEVCYKHIKHLISCVFSDMSSPQSDLSFDSAQVSTQKESQHHPTTQDSHQEIFQSQPLSLQSDGSIFSQTSCSTPEGISLNLASKGYSCSQSSQSSIEGYSFSLPSQKKHSSPQTSHSGTETSHNVTPDGQTVRFTYRSSTKSPEGFSLSFPSQNLDSPSDKLVFHESECTTMKVKTQLFSESSTDVLYSKSVDVSENIQHTLGGREQHQPVTDHPGHLWCSDNLGGGDQDHHHHRVPDHPGHLWCSDTLGGEEQDQLHQSDSDTRRILVSEILDSLTQEEIESLDQATRSKIAYMLGCSGNREMKQIANNQKLKASRNIEKLNLSEKEILTTIYDCEILHKFMEGITMKKPRCAEEPYPRSAVLQASAFEALLKCINSKCIGLSMLKKNFKLACSKSSFQDFNPGGGRAVLQNLPKGDVLKQREGAGLFVADNAQGSNQNRKPFPHYFL